MNPGLVFHAANRHPTEVTTPNGRETEFGVSGIGACTSRTEVMGRSGLLRRCAHRSEVWAFGQTAGTGDSTLTLSLSRALAGRNIGRFGMRGRGDRAGAWGCPESLRDDAGLMDVGARYYDAQVGRFMTRDTVLSEHPYLYCEHDAVNAVDPSGAL